MVSHMTHGLSNTVSQCLKELNTLMSKIPLSNPQAQPSGDLSSVLHVEISIPLVFRLTRASNDISIISFDTFDSFLCCLSYLPGPTHLCTTTYLLSRIDKMAPTGTEKELNFLLDCIRYGELKVDWAAIDKKNGSQNKIPGATA
jgi:hypothetical protein